MSPRQLLCVMHRTMQMYDCDRFVVFFVTPDKFLMIQNDCPKFICSVWHLFWRCCKTLIGCHEVNSRYQIVAYFLLLNPRRKGTNMKLKERFITNIFLGKINKHICDVFLCPLTESLCPFGSNSLLNRLFDFKKQSIIL